MYAAIDKVFRNEFPDQYLKRFFRGLFAVHRAAYEDSLQYEQPEALNYEPFARRAKVQTLAHEVAKQVGGVTAIPSQGDITRSSWFHRRIQHGRAILTISSASDPEEVIPISNFRYQYAQSAYRQRSLFEVQDSQVKLEPDDWIVYGMLLHGRGLERRGRLGFAVIRFPIRDASDYYAARIDLFKEFPSIVAECQPASDDKSDDDDFGIDFHEGEDVG